jgi:hypothetical protein
MIMADEMLLFYNVHNVHAIMLCMCDNLNVCVKFAYVDSCTYLCICNSLCYVYGICSFSDADLAPVPKLLFCV